MKVWTRLSESDLYDIAESVGVALSTQQTSTEHWNGSGVHRTELPKVGRAYSFGLRPLKGLGKRDGDYKYQRTSASFYGNGRRVFAVCWHGWRDYMLALYERDPDARIKTAVADYKNREDFLDKYEDTGYRNVGPPIAPMAMAEVCNCWKGNW